MSMQILNQKFKEGFTRVTPLAHKEYPVIEIEIKGTKKLKTKKRGSNGRFTR